VETVAVVVVVVVVVVVAVIVVVVVVVVVVVTVLCVQVHWTLVVVNIRREATLHYDSMGSVDGEDVGTPRCLDIVRSVSTSESMFSCLLAVRRFCVVYHVHLRLLT
jgi:hypothetical protein